MSQPPTHFGRCEIRYLADGTVDEIVVSSEEGECILHMEKMDSNHFWIGLYNGPEQKDLHINSKTDIVVLEDDLPEPEPCGKCPRCGQIDDGNRGFCPLTEEEWSQSCEWGKSQRV